jgi:hypothetical protein
MTSTSFSQYVGPGPGGLTDSRHDRARSTALAHRPAIRRFISLGES